MNGTGMLLNYAIKLAKSRSLCVPGTVFIVYDPSCGGREEYSYWAANDEDCDTYFAGAKIITGFNYGWEV